MHLSLLLALSIGTLTLAGTSVRADEVAEDLLHLVPSDPIYAPRAPRPGDQTYTVKLRMIRRGVNIKSEYFDRQLRAVEAIYSQCDGVNFKLKIENDLKTDSVSADFGNKAQGGLDGDQYTLGEDFVRFFEPWRASRLEKTIDIHWVDMLDGQTQGHAFSSNRMDQIYHAIWPSSVSPLSPSQIGGDVVTVALKTATAYEKDMSYLRKPGTSLKSNNFIEGWKNRTSSLLAHELGHILLEDTQTFNHHCVSTSDHECPRTNLMSAGGTAEHVYFKPPKFKDSDILGYTPLPALEAHQCENLKHHPWVEIR